MTLDRQTLKVAFETGKTPTQDDFGNLIDSMLNREDDNVFRPGVADPLSIKAVGAEESLLNFYRVDPSGETKLTWQMKQKHGVRPGLSIHGRPPSVTPDGRENTKTVGYFFIETDTGNVGIGTMEPDSKLHVEGTVKAAKFSGDGSEITNLSASQITSGKLNAAQIPKLSASEISGTLTAAQLPSQVNDLTIGKYLKTQSSTSSESHFSQRLFFQQVNSAASDNHGFSLMYCGYGNPKLGGRHFGLPKDAFHILTHNDSSTGTPALTILQSNGNVGIGTTSPKGLFEVNGIQRLTGKVSGQGWEFSGKETKFKEELNVGDTILINGQSTKVRVVYNNTAFGTDPRGPNFQRTNAAAVFKTGTPALLVNEDKVGIGTTDPKSVLHVHGLVMQTQAVDQSMRDAFAQAPPSSMMFAVSDHGSLSFWWKDSKGISHFGEIYQTPTA